MALSTLNDESLLLFYDSIRREVEADRAAFKTGRFFAAGDGVRKYATSLREEMDRRRLRFTPIDWWHDHYR